MVLVLLYFFIFLNQKSDGQLDVIKRSNVENASDETKSVSSTETKVKKSSDIVKAQKNKLENSLVKKVMELSNEAIDEIAEWKGNLMMS